MSESSPLSSQIQEFSLWEKMRSNRRPVSFSLEITARCNNNCRHCYINLPVADRAAEEAELLPPRTGSLIDCAQEVAPAAIPDISDISMAEAGGILDETPPPPPLEIDTSELSATTASLEDCQQQQEAVEIPDISELSATEPNTGSLEDCYQAVDPVEIPDISNLELADSEEPQEQ